MLEIFPLDHVHPNPWQTRLGEDESHVAQLAADIAARGMLQTPQGRRVPSPSQGEGQGEGHVQLAFGHSRLAAFKHLHAAFGPDGSNQDGVNWSVFPVDVVYLDDRQMAEAAIAENAQRRDLSAIEKATALQRYMADFHASQAAAGILFGLSTQGAVSNILRLLRLPAEIQDLVQAGTLPERLARVLIPLSQVDEKAAVTAAKVIAKREPDEREAELYDHLENHVRRHGHNLNYTSWNNLGWPENPIATGNPHLPEIPPCTGCPFNVRTSAEDADRRGCIRKECYRLKERAWADAEAQRVGQKMGIAVAGKGEKPTIVFDGKYNQKEFALKAVAARHASLRLVPHVQQMGGGWSLKDVLGSEFVHLGSTDVHALKKAVAAAPKPKAAKRELTQYEKQTQARLAKQRAQSKVVRELIGSAAPIFASLVPPVLHDMLFNKVVYDIAHSMGEARKKWKAASTQERGELIMQAVLKDYVELRRYSAPDPEKTAKKLADLAKAAKLKLPPGWDTPLEPNANSKKRIA